MRSSPSATARRRLPAVPAAGAPRRGESARPFLKWAGGKSQLLRQFAPLYPHGGPIGRYLEPFVGSGAVFFDVQSRLRPAKAILADQSPDLVNLYTVVRDDVESLIEALERHRKSHSEEHYYVVRAQEPSRLGPVARAARLVYLNKTCFNGLYRVNRKGQFNVPMGRYPNPSILDARNLRLASAALARAALRVAHFEETPAYARAGDFVYLDPPYHPLSRTASFTAYTGGAFREADQIALAGVFERLDRMGCLLMLSNSATPLIRELYASFDIRPVLARRSINSRSDRRGRIPEVVVLNYRPRDAAAAGAAR